MLFSRKIEIPDDLYKRAETVMARWVNERAFKCLRRMERAEEGQLKWMSIRAIDSPYEDLRYARGFVGLVAWRLANVRETTEIPSGVGPFETSSWAWTIGGWCLEALGSLGVSGPQLNEYIGRLIAEHDALNKALEQPDPGPLLTEFMRPFLVRLCALTTRMVAESGIDPKKPLNRLIDASEQADLARVGLTVSGW